MADLSEADMSFADMTRAELDYSEDRMKQPKCRPAGGALPWVGRGSPTRESSEMPPRLGNGEFSFYFAM
jgi:hypothetical protein